MSSENKDYLSNLLPELMDGILMESDFKSVQSLRKVCRDLRNFIDDSNIDFNLTALAIDARPDEISFFLEARETTATIQYKNMENGCLVICEKNQKLLEGQNFMATARSDLKEILGRHKGVLDGLSFSILDIEPIDQFIQNIKDDLNGKRLEAKLIECNVSRPDQLIPLLENIESKSIQNLVITNNRLHPRAQRMEYMPLAEMDIWKRAISIDITGFDCSGEISRFSHCTYGRVRMRWITIAHVIRLRQAFLSVPGFKCFVLAFREFHNLPQFLNGMGPRYVEGPLHDNEIRSWFYHIPTTETALHIALIPGNIILYRVVPTMMIEEHLIF